MEDYRNPQTAVKDARWFAGKGRSVAELSRVPAAGGLGFLDVRYADGGAERYLDIPEGFAWSPLLARGSVAGAGGRLELRAGAPLDVGGVERVPAVDQSNTLVAIGERLLVKAYRRLEPGVHPEIELLGALAGRGAPVPEFAGSVVWVADGGEEVALALLQEFVPGAESGWEAPIERAAAELRGGSGVDSPGWHAAGRAAGELHAALADAFGMARATRADLARWRAAAEASLVAAPPGVAVAVRERLAAFDTVELPALTRIHGDLHVAQLRRRGLDPPLVIDFEGDPLRPLADRRRPDTPLRDLAGLLRSVDHVGSAASRRAGGAAPDAWIDAASAAVIDGYSAVAPVPVDGELLAVLELAKECAELVYAQRVLPEWSYAPQLGLARLLER